MYKFLNLFFIILVLIFFISSYKYYSSNKNMKVKLHNRNNIDQIINDKISNLPILPNDTNNVIEFDNILNNEMKNDKPRSFWKLLKSK